MTHLFIKRIERLFLIFIALTFSFSLLALLTQIDISKDDSNNSSLQFTIPAKLGDAELWLAKAQTNKERITGLSGHSGLLENQGLLFVFNEPGRHAIWMKDMLFAIDVLWLDGELRVIHIERGLTPESFPKVFTPSTSALFVLEMRAGATDTLSIGKGDQLDFF